MQDYLIEVSCMSLSSLVTVDYIMEVRVSNFLVLVE